MNITGFSTGSLAKGNYEQALKIVWQHPMIQAIELSALREPELPSLLQNLPVLLKRLQPRFEYISVHAPSKLILFSELEMVGMLQQLLPYNIPVIVHPDIITDFSIWRRLGSILCIENMDKRKPIGRTTTDLVSIFNQLPEASFCLDLAHAKQVDPTMVECVSMLRNFGSRLKQFHLSDVTSNSNHISMNVSAIESYKKVSNIFPKDIPVIIESPVTDVYLEKEYMYANSLFNLEFRQALHPFVTAG